MWTLQVDSPQQNPIGILMFRHIALCSPLTPSHIAHIIYTDLNNIFRRETNTNLCGQLGFLNNHNKLHNVKLINWPVRHGKTPVLLVAIHLK